MDENKVTDDIKNNTDETISDKEETDNDVIIIGDEDKETDGSTTTDAEPVDSEENIIFLSHPSKVINDIIDTIEEKYPREDIEKKLREAGTYINALASIYYRPSIEAEEIHQRIIHVKNDGVELKTALKDEEGKLILANSKRKIKTTSGLLSGREAVDAFKSSRNKKFGMRIPLYNSGFWIELENPSNAQLNEFVNRVTLEQDELGRMLGGLYYTHMDYHVKEQEAKLISELTVYASFKGFAQGNNLLKAISIEDYDVILMNIVGQMYPDGYPKFEFPCVNPKGTCNHIFKETIDPSRMIYHNYSKLSNENIRFLRRSLTGDSNPSLEDLEDYRNSILFNEPDPEHPERKNEVVWNEFRFILQSPVYFDYSQYASSYIDLIRKLVNSENESVEYRRQKIQEAISYRMLKQFAPWIKEIKRTDHDITTNDRFAIEEILDFIQTLDIDNEVFGLISTAINKHKISHVGYPVMKCPKCNYEPEHESGFVTISPLQHFFTICVEKLQRQVR